MANLYIRKILLLAGNSFSKFIFLCILSRENAQRDQIPIHDPLPMKIILRKSILGSVSYCLVILRTAPYWLVRVALCNLNLAPGIHFSADHAQQATCKLSSTSQKISARKNLARVAADEQNGPRLREFIGKSGSDSTKIAYVGLSYISI